MNIKIYINVLILLVAGCETQSHNNRSYVSKGIQERTDYELGQISKPGKFHLPDGASFDDGLSEDEAVAIALWNNAQFQADLATLGFARADLIEADMLANPVFSLFFPVGPKLLESKLNFPIDALWQRPHRIAAAKYDAQALSENLVDHGLGLVRDVKTTYTDLWLAREQVKLAGQDARLRDEMADLAQRRLRAGDISELTASAAYIDSLRAADATKRFSNQAAVLKHQLNALLGRISDGTAFDIKLPDISGKSAASINELLETALAARPDLRAAELAIEAAGERIGWEKSKIYNFIAIIDAKDKGEDSLTVGPGFSLEIPIFNQNNGKIARAEAELEQAARQYEAVRQNIILQVRQAHTKYISAQEEYQLWNSDIIPSLETTLERTRKSFEAGELPYISVLQARQTLIEAQLHKTELVGHLHRIAAELNYCIGKKMV